MLHFVKRFELEMQRIKNTLVVFYTDCMGSGKPLTEKLSNYLKDL